MVNYMYQQRELPRSYFVGKMFAKLRYLICYLLDEIYSPSGSSLSLVWYLLSKEALLSSPIENRVGEGRWLDGIDSAGWTHTRHYLHSQVAGGGAGRKFHFWPRPSGEKFNFHRRRHRHKSVITLYCSGAVIVNFLLHNEYKKALGRYFCFVFVVCAMRFIFMIDS